MLIHLCRKERWVNVKFIQFNCLWIQGRVSANLCLISANGMGSYSAMARLGNLKKKEYSLWLVSANGIDSYSAMARFGNLRLKKIAFFAMARLGQWYMQL